MIDNQELYDKVKAYADTIYKKNSGYKSGFIQKIYKQEGGTYTDTGKDKPLKRWFKEQWSDISDKEYPVYRPTIKVSKSKTPLTVSEIDPKQLEEQIKLKQIIKGEKNLPKFEKLLMGGLSNLILHAIILKKPEFQTKEQAYKYSQEHFNEHLKNKKFIRETSTSFRVRVHPKQHFEKTTFVSKKISPDITLVFGKPNEKYRGGAIDQKELKQFVDAGYKSKRDVKNIDGYVLDDELSTRRDKVYVNPNTGKVVHTISGTDNLMDWSNNLLIPLGLHSKTNRYKNAEETQKKANAKYGKQNVSVVSHSQSGNIANTLDKRNLVGDENITLNPAIIGKTNAKVVKSYFDPVSYFTKTKKSDVVLKPTSINPLKEHSSSILEGKGRKRCIKK
jgi:hypothetical protein